MSKTSLHKNAIQLRQPLDGLEDVISAETALVTPEPSLAQQNFAEEADINTIVNRYLRTGEMPEYSQAGWGVDITGLPADYHAMLNALNAADDAFMQLPANVRARFNNDAGEFVEFFNDPANQDEMISLGLATDSRTSSDPRFQNSAVGADDGTSPNPLDGGEVKPSKKPVKMAGGSLHDGGAGD